VLTIPEKCRFCDVDLVDVEDLVTAVTRNMLDVVQLGALAPAPGRIEPFLVCPKCQLVYAGIWKEDA
jgi:hypothetical protein